MYLMRASQESFSSLHDFSNIATALREHNPRLVTLEKARVLVLASMLGFSSREVRTELYFEWMNEFRKDPGTKGVYLLRNFDVEGLKNTFFLYAHLTPAQIFVCSEDLSMRLTREYICIFCSQGYPKKLDKFDEGRFL